MTRKVDCWYVTSLVLVLTNGQPAEIVLLLSWHAKLICWYATSLVLVLTIISNFKHTPNISWISFCLNYLSPTFSHKSFSLFRKRWKSYWQLFQLAGFFVVNKNQCWTNGQPAEIVQFLLSWHASWSVDSKVDDTSLVLVLTNGPAEQISGADKLLWLSPILLGSQLTPVFPHKKQRSALFGKTRYLYLYYYYYN